MSAEHEYRPGMVIYIMARRRQVAPFRKYMPLVKYGYKLGKRLYRSYSAARTAPAKKQRFMPSGMSLIQKGRSRRWKRSKASMRAKKLKALGVTSPASPRFIQVAATNSFTVSQGAKNMALASTTLAGFNSKYMLDAIYTQESYADFDRKICVASQVDSYLLANQSNGGVYVTARYMKWKKDWTSTYGTISANLIQEGFNNVGLANSTEQLPITSIYQNQKLMNWCQVKKTDRFFLAAGGVRKLTYSDKNIKKLKFQYKTESTISYLRGSCFLLIEVHGTPIHDQSTAANIDTAATVIDVYQNVQWKYYTTDDTNFFQVTVDDNITNPVTPVRFIEDTRTEQAVAT